MNFLTKQLLTMTQDPTGAIINRLVGVTDTQDLSTNAAVMNMPVGTAIGDLMILVARCRNDRSVTVPSGWAEIHSSQQGTASSDIRTRIFSKINSGESSVTVTQNVSAAIGVSLVTLRQASSAQAFLRTANSFVYTKLAESNSVLVFYVSNNIPSANIDTASMIAGFEPLQDSKLLSVNDYFYYIRPHLRESGDLTDNVVITGSATTVASASRAAIVVEIS